MAVDVERALLETIALHGGMSETEAKSYLATMTDSQRYARDIY